jgi:trans-aconitate methyltransferase
MNVSATLAAFTQTASAYEIARRALIPCYEAFYGNVIDLIAYENFAAPLRCLDLGAGTGLLASHIKTCWPDARVHLIDGSDAMLALARERFGTDPLMSYELADLNDAELKGPYDVIVSALAIHHLTNEGKQGLFKRIFAALRSGGLFINAEQVASPTEARGKRYQEIWTLEAKTRGATEADLEAAAVRMAHDLCAPVEEQLGWMRAAGFTDADCTFKAWRFAVLCGTRDK